MNGSKVMFLTNEDFDQNGILTYQPDKPVICMIYADWCPHCIHLKPTYVEFANQKGDDTVVAIHTDSDLPSVKALMTRLPKIIPKAQGLPTIVKFKDGKYVGEYSGDRSLNSLIDFSN